MNITQHRLQYPEPEATGTGSPEPALPTPADPAPTPEQPAPPANPFDFTQFTDEPETAPAEPPADPSPYQIEFGEQFVGSADDRELITKHAQACGLEAATASKFVNAVYAGIRERQQEHDAAELQALQNIWGADFDRNTHATGKLIFDACKELGVPQEAMVSFMRPDTYLLVNHLRSKMGETRAVGLATPSRKEGPEDAMRLLNAPGSEEVSILSNPNHPKYRETADAMNKRFGVNLF